mmetsp:Transcript_23330/g.36006  ORF Transcript_23330/g.36006 Transcript_23330/m.36006 type:complete len:94 (-) Transcript_23330:53-334(-)
MPPQETQPLLEEKFKLDVVSDDRHPKRVQFGVINSVGTMSNDSDDIVMDEELIIREKNRKTNQPEKRRRISITGVKHEELLKKRKETMETQQE